MPNYRTLSQIAPSSVFRSVYSVQCNATPASDEFTLQPQLNTLATFPIVGIGASAGGLEATKQLLAGLPAEPGMAFVLIQHLDATHPSELKYILSRVTAMPVLDAQHGEEIKPNHFYVVPSDVMLKIDGGKFSTTPRAPGEHSEFLIDRFFRSLAQDAQSRAIAVVLSGSGSDGQLGACEIKAAGGVALAQTEESAGHAGMPRAAADSGCVDFILPPAEIAGCLMRLSSHPYLTSAADPIADAAASDYDEVVKYMRIATGIDFSQDRSTTILRRILRRSMLASHESLAKYLEQLKQDNAEVSALQFDLLITVTSFFRDAPMFDCLKGTVIPAILDGKPADAPVRVWVAGCSTGQEAYSIAMLLLEGLDGRRHHQLQVFATDLSGDVILSKARGGFYPLRIESEVSAERLQRFFDKSDDGYRIKKPVRDMCIFTQQNITSDPPFSHLDLIACRNVLIYMSPARQQRVIQIFHHALNVPGYLVLGSAETVGPFAHHFEVIDRVAKIYEKKSLGAIIPQAPGSPFSRWRGPAGSVLTDRAPVIGDFHAEADRVLLSRYAPPGVLIDGNLNVLEFRGHTSHYLEMPTGQPTTSLLKLADDGLILELRNALAETKAVEGPVARYGITVRVSGVYRKVDLEVTPIAMAGARYHCYLVLFHDAADPPPGALRATHTGLIRDCISWVEKWRPAPLARLANGAAGTAGIERLQQEHAATKEFLQSLLDERESSNEELRAANEEVLSANEALQSTNEKLETAKEELQSLNEELTTVNEQLNHQSVI